jgi:hypothetical protein
MVFASPGHDNGSFETAADGNLRPAATPYEPMVADECSE